MLPPAHGGPHAVAPGQPRGGHSAGTLDALRAIDDDLLALMTPGQTGSYEVSESPAAAEPTATMETYCEDQGLNRIRPAISSASYAHAPCCRSGEVVTSRATMGTIFMCQEGSAVVTRRRP